MLPRIVDDARHGRLKPRYRADAVPAPEQIVAPRPGIFDADDKYDWHASLLSITRGCPFGCDWCNVPCYQGDQVRLRPIERVVDEIRALAGKEFYIADDMVMLNRPRLQRYMLDLCERIRDFNVSMFLSCSPAMNADPAFLDALARAGAKSMYVVFASDPVSARFYGGNQAMTQRAIDLVNQLEDRGIRFFGSFSLGFDCGGEDQFDRVLDYCRRASVKTAEFFIATPFPGTPLWRRIESENRFLLPRDWRAYNCAHVVFRPKPVTEQQLLDGYLRCWREFYSAVDHAQALETFRQKAANILKSREYSQQVKDAVARGLRG